MTVAELIAELLELPQDLPVRVYVEGGEEDIDHFGLSPDGTYVIL